MIGLFSPTRFEIPPRLHLRAKTFGMGERRARSLARTLNTLHSSYERIVVFGSAGGLRPEIKAGEVFEVTEIAEGTSVIQLSPKTQLPPSKIFTSKCILTTREHKRVAHEVHGADLVDMEIRFLWDEAQPELRSKLIFIRSVFDPFDHELFPSWLWPLQATKNYVRYLRGISRGLNDYIFRR